VNAFFRGLIMLALFVGCVLVGTLGGCFVGLALEGLTGSGGMALGLVAGALIGGAAGIALAARHL
jgi:hypothetical protein